MLIRPGPPPPPPRVSVIITAFDQAGFVGSAIESVLIQTLPDVEVVVVDDAAQRTG